MKKTKKNTGISMDEEMMMWCAYRYAIGRHTYVTTLADYIAKNYYNKLSDERLIFTYKDIIKCINNQLNFGSPNIWYDGTVPYDERNGFEDLMKFMQDNITCEDDLGKYEKIEIYKESYAADAPKLFRTYSCEPIQHHYYTEMNIDDLLPWVNLASLFNKDNYKLVHTKCNGVEQDIVCFESWQKTAKPVEGSEGYYQYIPYKYEKCYYSVDNYINRGMYSGYIANEYITGVENYENK